MGTRGAGIKDEFETEDEVSEESFESFEEGKFGERFVKCVQKVIKLNKVVKVLKEIKRENRQVNMADEFKMTLPIFDGKDYSTWKKRITIFLRMKKCETVIQRARSEAENEATWIEKDLKAMNYIYSALSNRQMDLVNDENTSYEIIKKLDKLYLRESTALQICVRNKLERLKLKDFTEISEFFSEFEKLTIELKNAGATVNESEKLNYLLRTLPSSLSYIGDLVDVLPEQERTVDYVINKIKLYEEREKDENQNSKMKSGNSNVFRSEVKKDRTCFKCGKPGHYQYDCTSQSNGGNSWRGSRGGRQQQARGGVSYQPQQRDSGSYSRGSSAYRGRGAGHRGRGGQQRQDRQIIGQNAMTFLSETEGTVNYSSEVNNCENELEWVLDSGCSDHIINNDKYFVKLSKLENPINVKVGDGRTLKATKVGDIKAKFITNFNETELTLKDVFFVKEMDKNLMSFGKVAEIAKIVSFGNNSKIYLENKLVGVANKVNNLYKINTIFESKQNYTTENINNGMTLKEKFHRILGHVNFGYLNILSKNNLVEGLPSNLESEYLKCGTCIQNKMTNTVFENNRYRAREIGEIIHADVNGPHSTVGYMGEKYFLVLIDDFSKVGKVYTMKNKNEVCHWIITYVNLVENLTEKKIKRLRCDNGKEFLNRDIYEFAKEKGIFIEPCPPYVHELNGTAERYNRSIMETARCLLADAKIHNRFWPEVVKTAAYLKNRTLANTSKEKTPYEIMMGRKPDIKNLKLYGSRVFVRVPEIKRKNKWDRKADLGVLVGYEDVGYRILINNKIIVAKHVDIIEENVKLVGFNGNDEITDNSLNENKTDQQSKNENESSIINENDNIENDGSENDENNVNILPSTSNHNLGPVRRSERKKSPIDRYGNPVTNCIYVNYVSVDNPENYNEAINSNESENWRDAMNKEIECLKRNDTWKLVKRPKDKKILDLKWVYTKKAENKYKARIVVRGFQQREIIEDIYSPVARTQTLKILLNYCIQKDLEIDQMDVEAAFLNGKIKSEVYVKQPQGYDDNTGRVCKLEKSLYGLRESPRAWYECYMLMKTEPYVTRCY